MLKSCSHWQIQHLIITAIRNVADYINISATLQNSTPSLPTIQFSLNILSLTYYDD